MKIIVNSKTLLEKLQNLNAIISANPTIEILDNFLFKRLDHKIELTSSDIDNTLITSVDCDIREDGDLNIAVPAKMLIDILKVLPEQPLTFIKKDNNTIEIISGSGNYVLPYFFGNLFPKVPEIQAISEIKVTAKQLHSGISRTVNATGTDEIRKMLTGVLFEIKDGYLNMVATDANKLVKLSYKQESTTDNSQFIMPKKPLNTLKGILNNSNEDVCIFYNETNARITMGEYTLISRLIDQKYPDYQKIIPIEYSKKLTINRVQFINSLKCVSVFSNKENNQIKLDIKGNSLQISAEDVNFSKNAKESLTCSYEGDNIEIGFNSRYIIEMLQILHSEEVVVEMNNPMKAGVIKPLENDTDEEILIIVMPVMLHK